MVASFVLIMLAMNVQLNLVAAMVDAEGVEDATEDRDRVTEEDPDQDHATVDVHDPDPANADDQVVGEDDVDLAAMIDPDRDQTEEAVTTNLDHDRNPDLARRAGKYCILVLVVIPKPSFQIPISIAMKLV